MLQGGGHGVHPLDPQCWRTFRSSRHDDDSPLKLPGRFRAAEWFYLFAGVWEDAPAPKGPLMQFSQNLLGFGNGAVHHFDRELNLKLVNDERRLKSKNPGIVQGIGHAHSSLQQLRHY